MFDIHHVITFNIQAEQDRLEFIRILLENGYAIKGRHNDSTAVLVSIPATCEYSNEQTTNQSDEACKSVGEVHWVKHTYVDYTGSKETDYYSCSNCNDRPLFNGDESEALSEYCPHCGSKILGVVDHVDDSI